MSFAWTPHRFAGGCLALDVANSVILRFDPRRSVDRFADPAQVDAFIPAANALCGERHVFGALEAPSPGCLARLVAVREAVDLYFRGCVLGSANRSDLADLLDATAAALRMSVSDAALEAQTAYSALRLLGNGADAKPMKICGHCGWLFIDRSRNRSRTWCDMAVCGNRAKASRHYRKRKENPA